MRDDDLRRLLLEARVAADDMHTTVKDRLRPRQKRELGPVLHRRHIKEAYGKLIAILDHLLREAGGAPPSTEAGPAVQ